MRISILFLTVFAFLITAPASAKPGANQSEAQARTGVAQACDELRGGTKGLYGLCVAFCAQNDQSNVDMNDIMSVREAAPNISLLNEYNEQKTEDDPVMPCLIDDGDDDSDDNEPPGEPSCGCWTTEELQDIDGALAATRDLIPGVECTANESEVEIYEAQIYEGYNLSSTEPGIVTSAFAYVSPDGSGETQGCMFQSATAGIRNFPLAERAEAEQCIQMIVSQCNAIGQ